MTTISERIPGVAAALDALDSPAFVVDAAGRIELANTAGLGRIASGSGPTLPGGPSQDHGVIPASAEFAFIPLAAPDVGAYYLAIRRAAAPDPLHRAQTIARRWDLTARQSTVLALVARGDANKSIATQLGCAENTVELHMTRLLAKAQVDNRAALVARFWTELV